MGDDGAMVDCYLLAIATYRRPADLQKLLDSLIMGVAGVKTEILVVDNDPEGSARSIVSEHPLGPTYALEAKAGIAAARNRALEYFDNRHAGIVFVDDDEWVSEGWLAELVNYAATSGAGVVVGPVISALPADVPLWVKRGGFIQRPIWTTGHVLATAPTNNTLLLRAAWLRAGAPRFDPSFSETGGSDADLFRGVCKSGVSIRYCAEAVVQEAVPTDRLTVRWLRRRALRNGIAQTRIRLKHGDSLLKGLLGGLLYMAYGVVFLCIGLLRGQGLQAKPFNYLFLGYGRFAALLNYRIREYARAPATTV